MICIYHINCMQVQRYLPFQSAQLCSPQECFPQQAQTKQLQAATYCFPPKYVAWHVFIVRKLRFTSQQQSDILLYMLIPVKYSPSPSTLLRHGGFSFSSQYTIQSIHNQSPPAGLLTCTGFSVPKTSPFRNGEFSRFIQGLSYTAVFRLVPIELETSVNFQLVLLIHICTNFQQCKISSMVLRDTTDKSYFHLSKEGFSLSSDLSIGLRVSWKSAAETSTIYVNCLLFH